MYPYKSKISTKYFLMKGAFIIIYEVLHSTKDDVEISIFKGGELQMRHDVPLDDARKSWKEHIGKGYKFVGSQEA